ncbi:hypothetical protein ACRAWB_03710 [Leifsonia poae]|uniref:hypothetical protein n=1 Tax=Leifsonia poae TaxID=110933 RepID=UPI003D68A07A
MRAKGYRRLAAVLVVALPLTLAACSSGGAAAEDTATPDPTTEGTQTGASAAPPANTQCATPDEKSPYDPVPATAGSTSGTTWVGVFQHVDASIKPDGSIDGTPKATTVLSASGDTPVTVGIPLSTQDLKAEGGTKKPTVKDGVAQISIDPHGVTDQTYTSKYESKLPVTVKTSYAFNGKTVTADHVSRDIKGKDGTVTVSYTVTNTTTASTNACFTGFDGSPQQRTLSTPQPIVAYLSLTIPAGTESFTAPGAAPAHSKKGVDLSWTQALFQPLGPTTQTFTLTMTSKKSSVPKAGLTLATLDPTSITGKAAATSAQTLGAAQDAAGQAAAAVQSSLDALQQRMAAFENTRGTSPSSSSQQKQRGLSGLSLPSFAQGGVALPGVDLPDIPQPDLGSPAVTGPSLDDLAGLQTQFAALLAKLDPGPVNAKLAALTAAVDAPAPNIAKVRDTADAMLAIAGAVNSAAHDASAKLDTFVASLPPLLQKALAVRSALDTIEQDVAALQHPADAALAKLEKDLQDTKALADDVDTALNDLQSAATAARDQVTALAVQTASMVDAATTLKTTVDGELVAKQTAVDTALAGVSQTITTQLQQAQAAVQSLASSFDQKVSQTATGIQQSLAAAGAKVSSTLDQARAAVGAAASAAAEQAGQAIQDAEASAQASAAATSQKVQDAVTKANDDFAQLLCLNQQALLHQLPEGSASGVSAQNGRFHFEIKGT